MTNRDALAVHVNQSLCPSCCLRFYPCLSVFIRGSFSLCHLHPLQMTCDNPCVGSQHLPIWEIHSEIVSALTTGNRFVLVAPTGSGKTTQVPQMLLDGGLAGEKRIVVLQ